MITSFVEGSGRNRKVIDFPRDRTTRALMFAIIKDRMFPKAVAA